MTFLLLNAGMMPARGIIRLWRVRFIAIVLEAHYFRCYNSSTAQETRAVTRNIQRFPGHVRIAFHLPRNGSALFSNPVTSNRQAPF